MSHTSKKPSENGITAVQGFERIKSLNRHGASSIVLALLLVLAVAFHTLAWHKMDLAAYFALMDARTMREIRLIGYVHNHVWLPIFYAGLFFACLLWLEVREAPRWVVWLAFTLLAIPWFLYVRACEHISFKMLGL